MDPLNTNGLMPQIMLQTLKLPVSTNYLPERLTRHVNETFGGCARAKMDAEDNCIQDTALLNRRKIVLDGINGTTGL